MAFHFFWTGQTSSVLSNPPISFGSVSELIQPLKHYSGVILQWTHDHQEHLLAFFVGILVTVVAAFAISWIIRRVILSLCKKTETDLDDKLVEGIHAPLTTFIVVSGTVVSLVFVRLSAEAMSYVLRGYFAIAILIVVWGLLRATTIISDYMKEKAIRSGGQLDNLLVDLLRKVVKVTIWLVAVFFIAQNIFRLNVSAMLAGAGVLSLAVAFAAQNTISNIFGAISLIADKPFSIGERIIANGKDGVVEALGLRSTTLRALDGSVWSIPNKELSESAIQNLSRRPNFKHVFEVALVYSTSPEKMIRAVELMHEILDGNPMFNMKDQPPRIFFSDMKEWSLNIQAIVWFQTKDYFQMMSEREKLNLKILERFNAEGFEFAYPSNTTYLAGHATRPVELKK